MLTKQQILEAPDITKEKVAVPEWGGSVFVKMMSGDELNAYQQAQLTRDGRANMCGVYSKIAALTICDADGNALFSQAEALALGQKSAIALKRVVDVASRLSGLDDDDLEAAKKNSEIAQSDDSGSD